MCNGCFKISYVIIGTLDFEIDRLEHYLRNLNVYEFGNFMPIYNKKHMSYKKFEDIDVLAVGFVKEWSKLEIGAALKKFEKKDYKVKLTQTMIECKKIFDDVLKNKQTFVKHSN